MPAPLTATARQLMAYRITASGLDRQVSDVDDLAVWDIGVQDRDGSSALALAARLSPPLLRRWLADTAFVAEPAGTSPFVMAWTLRGSPHLHRRADLQSVADALWPASEADAQARLVGSGKRLRANGTSGLAGYEAVAHAMRIATAGAGAVAKGQLSAAVTTALPAEFSGLCEPCGSVHVFEMLFRVAALPGGLGLLPTGRATLQPLRPAVSRPTGQHSPIDLACAYFRLFGAGTAAEVAQYLGTAATPLKAARGLPQDLVPMLIEGITQVAPETAACEIAAADVEAASNLVRLLPPGDPLLQPRERALLISDRAAWKQLWPAIGPAGAVLAGGEIAGFWRQRKTGKLLTLSVGAFRPLSAADRTQIRAEAEIVAAARGTPSVDVTFTT